MGIQETIIAHVVDGILSGSFEPGSRLKGREDYGRLFNTTPVTVQRAFNQLIERGFVTSVKSSGTFVSEHPPCLCRYALVFPSSPQLSDWTFFQQAAVDSLAAIEQEAQVELKCYMGLGLRTDSMDTLKTFKSDLEDRTLAGAIFLSELRNFHKEAWSNVGVPFYSVSQPAFSQGFPRIELGKASFYSRAADKFKALGRKRIAIVANERYFTEWEAVAKTVFVQKKLAYQEEWVQVFSVSEQQGVNRFLKLLLSLPPSKRPDGVFIVDDNFLEQTHATLKELGVKIGRDVDVVCHANFPVQKKYPNLHRLGYHVPTAISSAVANLRSRATIEDLLIKPELDSGEKTRKTS